MSESTGNETRAPIDLDALRYQVFARAKDELIKWAKSWVIWVVIAIIVTAVGVLGGGTYLLKVYVDGAIESRAKVPIDQLTNTLSEMKGQIGAYAERVKEQKRQADELDHQQRKLQSDAVHLGANLGEIKHFLARGADTEVQDLVARVIVEDPDVFRDPIRKRLTELRDMLKAIEITDFATRPFIDAINLIDRKDRPSLEKAASVLRQAPDSMTKHRLLGYVHTRLGNKEPAAQAMKAAMDASRDSASRRREEDIKVRLNYAQYVLALQEKKYEQAEQEFRAALKELDAHPLRDPLMGAVLFGSAGIYSVSGKVSDALNDLVRANSHKFPVIDEVERDTDSFFKNLKAELGKGGKSWKQELRRLLGSF